jgi:hypothetical protein
MAADTRSSRASTSGDLADDASRPDEVAIITPVRHLDARLLAATADSVAAQGHRPLRWVVQHDGAGPIAVPPCAGVALDVGDNGRWLGVALTHNRALARVRGAYVMALGADDLLEPQAVALLLAALRAHPTAAFVTGRTRFIEEGGALGAHHDEGPYRSGLLPAGTISDRWERTGHYGLVPGAAMWRSDHLRALGGWAAVGAGSDANALMAGAAMWPSVWLAEPVYRYRMHPGQLTKAGSTTAERVLQLTMKRQRLAAIRRLRRTAGSDAAAAAEPIGS